ncbi:TIGR01777 family oxidoreductase [Thermodesulfobacteriota bacterium]
MKILIIGGSGFVGSFLSRYLVDRGHHVIATGMRHRHNLSSGNRFAYVSVDTTVPGSWQDRVSEVDAVINLAGRNIFRYWTETTKRQIHESRILTTRNLVMAMGKKQGPSLLNASAIGYYGDRGDEFLGESSSVGDAFLAGVSVDWEKEALQAEAKGARVALLRFSVILGKNGGALAKMLPAFKSFAGGPMGSGMQWFSWMHIQDLAAAVEMILVNEDMKGSFNFCSPHPERNQTFAKALGNALGRPAFLRTPAFVLKLILGELGDVMLGSQRCVPKKLQRHGFEFQYPILKNALENLLNE